jgi:hypothetical protein
MTVVKFPCSECAAKKAADGEIEAKQAKAYFDMEPHLCAVS